MLSDEVSGVPASNLLAIGSADRFTKVSKDFRRGTVIGSSPSVDVLCRDSQPSLRFLHHLLHSVLSLAFHLGRFTPGGGLAFLFFLRVVIQRHESPSSIASPRASRVPTVDP
jgi:hypothetical protein